MLEHIISKMVLDRACPICGGLKRFKPTGKAREDSIVCSNCNGKGYMSDTEPSVLLVESIAAVPPGVVMSMETQQMFVVEDFRRLFEIKPHRVYTYNVHVKSEVFVGLTDGKLKEIHMYFGQI